MPSTTTHAFTLLELLVVIAIIGLLSSLVITQVRSARDKAHYAKALQFSAHLDRTLGAEAVGIWNFEEGTGTTATDVSGWGNDGTISGAVFSSDTYNDSLSDYSLSFDGLNDYVALPIYYDSAAIDPFSVSAWVKIPADGGEWSIVDFDRSEYYTCAVGISNTSATSIGDYVVFHTTGSGVLSDMYSNTPVRNNTWHHVAWVFDGSKKIIYIDGFGDAEQVVSSVGTGATRWGFIGDGSEADSFDGTRNNMYYNGLIDDVRIYSTALTAQEIKSHYLAGIDKLYAHGEIDEEEYQERLAVTQ